MSQEKLGESYTAKQTGEIRAESNISRPLNCETAVSAVIGSIPGHINRPADWLIEGKYHRLDL